MTFDPATLTRASVIASALSRPNFRKGVDQLKTATGFGPHSIHIKDDHNDGRRTYDVDNVLLVTRFNADGTPTPESRMSDSAWLASGSFPRSYDPWGQARSKNPLYVGDDGAVHVSTEARGYTLFLHQEDQTFETVADKNRGVYVKGTECAHEYPFGAYEAHVCLTLAELTAL